MNMIIVVIVSIILSSILNKVAESKGWKKRAEIYADDKTYLRALPIVLIIVYIGIVLGLPMLGINLAVAILLTIQVLCITLAVFLFELFR